MTGRVAALSLALTLMLAGCGAAETSAPVAEAAADVAEAAPAKGDGAAPVAVSVPRIAYIYRLGYRVAGDAIPKLQQAHVALCDRLGPTRCQVAGMQSSGGEADYASGTLKLRVESGVARAFITRLNAAAASAGGRTTETAIEAEDVSKQIVDASARIRQRELLVTRLTEVLRTRQGSVGDLVAAERAVAEAQEELDQAKGWLAELNGRVALSTVEISYGAQAADSGGFGAQLQDTLAQSGSLFLIGLRSLLTILIVLAPWALLFGPLVWLGLRWRRRRMARPVAPSD
ncbi:DUF4349 domain-containing protein [Sphingomonas sp.]|uniref:DUF4349 domain-containing protein n=1 Tax=Sphingomonas sp. TaxID=28214 RepID=UPI001EBD79DD|nr:DUF4349 domain-containing protein [Sphingomonas sp.]MBX3594645.1 DUF4349 domain-containing protein [Sphingomonas sp.]